MIHARLLFQKHKSKELVLEGDMVSNHYTYFEFYIYPRVMGGKYENFEFHNLF